MLLDLPLIFCIILASALVYALYSKFLRWSPLRNIPGPASASFITGNLGQLFDKNGQLFFDHLSQNFEKVVRLHGRFNTDILMIYDPLALYHLIVKDQELYPPPPHLIGSAKVLIGGDGLVTAVGEVHKKQRQLLAPAFSAVAMREMCSIFYGIAHKLHSAIQSRVQHGTSEIDISSWMSRTALQLIGEAGLGYSFDNLIDDNHIDDYAQSVRSLLEYVFQFRIGLMFTPLALRLASPKFYRRLVDITPWPALHRFRDLVDLQYDQSLKILRDKQQALIDGDAALAKKVGRGKDIMSILLRENMDAAEDDKMKDEDVLAQISVLILAATDTTSSALSRVLHLLAQNSHIQQKLRHELIDARAKVDGKDLSYDDVSSLPYLDAVCRETLRLYAPIAFRLRTALVNTILPLSKPLRGLDGKEMCDVHVPKGTLIIGAISACNRDPDIWGKDADQWKPERWLAPLPTSVTDARVPGIYTNVLTFWGGQRACIGFKFSQLEMKIVLALLVETFQFDLPVDKEIVWRFGSIAHPSIEGDEGPHASKMPLRVTYLK